VHGVRQPAVDPEGAGRARPPQLDHLAPGQRDDDPVRGDQDLRAPGGQEAASVRAGPSARASARSCS
jgi:hypothetical protein